MSWIAFDQGKSIGSRGSESGVIIRDEEHTDGARVTLEREGYHPFSITCGIYGWMVHTIFFSEEKKAQGAFEKIKGELELILGIIPAADDPEVDAKSEIVCKRISDFVAQYR